MEELPKYWAAAVPIITRALDYQDTHTIADIEEAILKKEAQLWTGKKSVLVTQIEAFPRNIKKSRFFYFFLVFLCRLFRGEIQKKKNKSAKKTQT